MLGACYFSGTGVRRDAEEAVSYWKIAAAKGEPLAQTNLGFCYESGVGVKRRDPATMVKWWHQAAARGVMEAQYNLAVAYNMHAHICLGGMEAAAEYAFNNFKASAEQGFAAAQNNYAVCLTSGSGGKRNLNAAFMLFRKSACVCASAAAAVHVLRIAEVHFIRTQSSEARRDYDGWCSASQDAHHIGVSSRGFCKLLLPISLSFKSIYLYIYADVCDSLRVSGIKGNKDWLQHKTIWPSAITMVMGVLKILMRLCGITILQLSKA